jgi:hypothetical protein
MQLHDWMLGDFQKYPAPPCYDWTLGDYQSQEYWDWHSSELKKLTGSHEDTVF